MVNLLKFLHHSDSELILSSCLIDDLYISNSDILLIIIIYIMILWNEHAIPLHYIVPLRSAFVKQTRYLSVLPLTHRTTLDVVTHQMHNKWITTKMQNDWMENVWSH